MKQKNRRRFGPIELIIAILVVAIVMVLAFPQAMSRRGGAIQLSGVQKQIVNSLREARQEAVTQKANVTFRYNDVNKSIAIWGGNFGTAGDSRNRVTTILSEGLKWDDVVYGRPDDMPARALDDGSNLITPSNSVVDITFQSDGSVLETGKSLQSKAMFFYSPRGSEATAFAVSIAGAGGRTKIWHYNSSVKAFVEQ